MHSTYVKAIIERSRNGRIYSTYKINGTATGRLASEKPNMQNIPRRKDVKNIFCGAGNKLILECDYSQAELRVLAGVTGDPILVDAYVQDRDLHDVTAKLIFGDEFTKEDRNKAKTVNFGIPYGTSAMNLADRLRIPLPEAEKLIKDWYTTMHVAGSWIKAKRNSIRTDSTAISTLGRRRRLGLVTDHSINHFQNEVVNFPIQSTASDFTLLSGVSILKHLRENKLDQEIKLVNTVHDAILVELPVDKLEYVVRLVTSTMSTIPSKYFPNVPFKAEAEWSATGWGNKEKIKMDKLSELQATLNAKEVRRLKESKIVDIDTNNVAEPVEMSFDSFATADSSELDSDEGED